MSDGSTTVASISVDVTVNLTAIVRPEPDAGGYSASIPALPGCHTQGETLDEVRSNLREAAEGARRRPRGRSCPLCCGRSSVKIISGKRMCRILEQRGWTVARINGAHHIYRHIYRHTATGRRTVVPVHENQDLKPGTQRGIMRDSGLADVDL